MSDPIEQLRALGAARLPVEPLSPADVRRLGDRRRARRNAGITVASVVAVLATATPFALLVDRPGQDTVPPSQTPTSTVSPTPTTSGPTKADDRDPLKIGLGDIPADFPLGKGAIDLTGDGGEQTGPAADVRTESPGLCDAPGLASARATGRIAFENTGPEYVEHRELRTYADTDTAVAVVEAFRTAVDDCPSWETDGITRTVVPLDLDTGYDSVTFAEMAEPYGPGFQVTRVGRAVLLVRKGGEASLDCWEGACGDEITTISKTVAQEMCLFTTKGCGGSATTTPSDTIPADFPLDLGAAEPENPEDRLGPGADVVVRSPTPCDATPFTATPATAKLSFRQGGREYDDLRELRVFPDTATSGDVISAIAESVGACPHEAPEGFAEVDWVTLQTEGDTLVVSSRGTSGVGDSTYLFTRVGRAILMIGRGGEGRRDLEAIRGVTRQITPYLCPWTDGGCTGDGADPTTERGSFGPTTYQGLALGMDRAAVEAAGWKVMSAQESGGPCLGLLPPGGGQVSRGYFHEEDGVTAIFGGADDATPEGIGKGSSEAAVKAAYPEGSKDLHSYWNVPLGDGQRYQFGIEGDGTVGEVNMSLVDQRCFG